MSAIFWFLLPLINIATTPCSLEEYDDVAFSFRGRDMTAFFNVCFEINLFRVYINLS